MQLCTGLYDKGLCSGFRQKFPPVKVEGMCVEIILPVFILLCSRLIDIAVKIQNINCQRYAGSGMNTFPRLMI